MVPPKLITRKAGGGSRHCSRFSFCLLVPTVRPTHQLAWYKEGQDTERRRKKARWPTSARLGEKMTLETANYLDKSRAHPPEMQKSAKATRNGQSNIHPPPKKNHQGL